MQLASAAEDHGPFAEGASVLLSVVPEGTTVQKGDVLAVLDSSDYEELVRLQRITVERSKADKTQAELNFQIAQLRASRVHRRNNA